MCKGRGFISTTKILRRTPETIPFVGHGGHNSYYYYYYYHRHRCIAHTRTHMSPQSFSRPHRGEQMRTTLSFSDFFPSCTPRASRPSAKTLSHRHYIIIIIHTELYNLPAAVYCMDEFRNEFPIEHNLLLR